MQNAQNSHEHRFVNSIDDEERHPRHGEFARRFNAADFSQKRKGFELIHGAESSAEESFKSERIERPEIVFDGAKVDFRLFGNLNVH